MSTSGDILKKINFPHINKQIYLKTFFKKDYICLCEWASEYFYEWDEAKEFKSYFINYDS